MILYLVSYCTSGISVMIWIKKAFIEITKPKEKVD